ncbi:AbrB/MazE/SpoVT family DNA-binding domain-containing protein [Patescibacteria group bacterium]|nr:AbrB/MazE/SpoVT family DNA-binding domain-containing protein [Patescibacteria group bacterium]
MKTRSQGSKSVTKKKNSSSHKVFRSGRALVVTVPAPVRECLGIRAGDPVNVKVDIDKQMITYKFPKTRQLRLLKGK